MPKRCLGAALFALLSLPLHAAEREVSVVTSNAEVTLAGTLLTPDGIDNPSLAILVTGSGNHVRDQVISGAPIFRQIAEQLQAAGIASLRVDSRGSGGSTGPKALQSAPMDRVTDMRSVVQWVRREMPASSTGILGHSEGASIAAELAVEDGVEWLVLLGAPARSGREVWVEQQTAGVAEAMPGQAEAIARGRAILEEAAQASIDGADKATLEAIAVRLFALVGIEEAKAREDGDIDNFAKRMTDTWMRGFLSYDPGPALDAVRLPTLAVYGSLDVLTSPVQNAGRLAERVARDHDKGFSLHILPDEDHFFLRGEGLPPGEHKAGRMALTPTLVPLIAQWLKGVASRH